jgi:hypothetical protein
MVVGFGTRVLYRRPERSGQLVRETAVHRPPLSQRQWAAAVYPFPVLVFADRERASFPGAQR